LIKARAQTRSWALQSYPGKVKLPSDILRALPNSEAVAKVRGIVRRIAREGGSCSWTMIQVIKTQYLSEETIKWLKEMRGHKPTAATKVCTRFEFETQHFVDRYLFLFRRRRNGNRGRRGMASHRLPSVKLLARESTARPSGFFCSPLIFCADNYVRPLLFFFAGVPRHKSRQSGTAISPKTKMNRRLLANRFPTRQIKQRRRAVRVLWALARLGRRVTRKRMAVNGQNEGRNLVGRRGLRRR
jgi:hypothetical protein